MRLIGITDTPILGKQEESLGVLPYIESLSEFVTTCDTPMTISIQGDWGSGKTSAMNMIREAIENQVIAVWFNTWQFSQFDMQKDLSLSLISYFVEELDDNDKMMSNKIGSVLKGLGKIAVTAVSEQILGEVATDRLTSSSSAFDSAKALKSLKAELQNVVEQRIKKSGKDRIIVFLDDLDRLAPEKAVELLEVLKNFLDVEGCVFVLAVDYSVVVQGIKKKLNTDELDEKGRSFFDKIIQLPFNMPIAQYNTETYCENLLKKINIDYDPKDVGTYIELTTASVGFNPRGLKRIFNLFQLLNIVAKKQEILNGDNKALKSEKQRMMFALLCMQSTFEPLYNFLVINVNELSSELLEMLKDQEKLQNDEQLFDLREKLKNMSDTTYKKMAKFMAIFYDAIQLQDDGNNESLSENELEQLKELLSFSSVTSTDLSTIQDANQGQKYKSIKLDSWDSFEKSIREKGERTHTQYMSLPSMKKLYDLANTMFGNDLKVVFTENGVMSFNSNSSKSRQKVFVYIEVMKKYTLTVYFFSPGKFISKKIEAENDFETWVPEELKAAHERLMLYIECKVKN